MSALPPPDAAVQRQWRDPFTAQLLDWIADEPGISTVKLAARLNQSKGRTGKYLARLRQAGQLTALIPKMGNRPYRWTLADYSPSTVEWPPELEPIAAKPKPKPEPIAAMPEPEPEPEPEIALESVADGSDSNHDDEEAGFSVATLHSARLPKGLTQEDLDWHRYWHSRAVQRASHSPRLENV
jgi:hypothetical protein